MSVLEIKCYVTNNGLIISNNSFPNMFLNNYRFNEIDKEKYIELKGGWILLEGVQKIEKVERWKSAEKKITRWALKDPSISSLSIPVYLLDKEVESFTDYDDNISWKNRVNIRSLYKPTYNTVDGCYENIDYNITVVAVIEGDITKPITTKFRLKDNFVRECPIGTITHYAEIDTILVPEFALHMKPCKLTKADSYKIIRSYILDNIDNKNARISSDYDFCFTVQKVVRVRVDVGESEFDGISINNRVKLKSENFKDKQFEIYNVAPKPYQEYSVVKAFEGDNMEDLVNNIQNFLNELITKINKPHYVCECCKGLGYTK